MPHRLKQLFATTLQESDARMWLLHKNGSVSISFDRCLSCEEALHQGAESRFKVIQKPPFVTRSANRYTDAQPAASQQAGSIFEWFVGTGITES
jgi:hypothetical protein